MNKDNELSISRTPIQIFVGIVIFEIFLYFVVNSYLHNYRFSLPLSVVGTFLIYFLFSPKKFTLDDYGITVKSLGKQKKISWNEVISMSKVMQSGGFRHYEIKTKRGVIKVPYFYNSKSFEEKIIKEADLEFIGDLGKSKKWYEYTSSVYQWKKRGLDYRLTSMEDFFESKDLFGGHQKIGWVVVLVGAALLLGVYLRLLLVH